MPTFSSPWRRARSFARQAFSPLEFVPPGIAPGSAAGLSKKQNSRRYPTRLTRYLIPYVWMRQLRQELGRPLRVAEIGTGTGQKKLCTDALWKWEQQAAGGGELLYTQWDGFDVAPQQARLTAAGYDLQEEFDADAGEFRDFPGYDVVLLLHVLEHLREPELFLERLAPRLDPGCLLLGGVPSTPEFLRGTRETQLRKKYLPGGHWCQFSSTRVAAILARPEWTAGEITGAFVVRASGLFLEDSPSWLRFNLAFAHVFPWWPGEVYFSARRS